MTILQSTLCTDVIPERLTQRQGPEVPF